MPISGPVLDVCSGPGGWRVAARNLGLKTVGLELDPVACATSRAAGFTTVRCDVSQVTLLRGLTGLMLRELLGLIGSPPCTMYSRNGWRVAAWIMTELHALIRDQFAGRDVAERLEAMLAILVDAGWMPQPVMTTAELAEARHGSVASAALVGEPARLIREGQPRWVALEQVPAASPLFETYAIELRARGYSVWTGILNGADYGLGQIRRRAILIASLDRVVSCPPPTHYDPARGPQMFAQPWRSMADVIGWGCTHRPSPTVTGGGIKSGGPEPFGHAARRALAAERDAGRWVPKPGVSELLQVVPRPMPEECALLQGFPPGYPFTGGIGKRIQQAGNAVPPPLALPVLAMASGRRVLEEAALCPPLPTAPVAASRLPRPRR